MIIDEHGEAIEDLTKPPVWATDPDAPIPTQYIRVSDTIDKFRLGTPPRAAAALVDRSAWCGPEANPEVLVTCAAGAWRALVGEDCDRDMAVLIAKAWIRGVELEHH